MLTNGAELNQKWYHVIFITLLSEQLGAISILKFGSLNNFAIGNKRQGSLNLVSKLVII